MWYPELQLLVNSGELGWAGYTWQVDWACPSSGIVQEGNLPRLSLKPPLRETQLCKEARLAAHRIILFAAGKHHFCGLFLSLALAHNISPLVY